MTIPLKTVEEEFKDHQKQHMSNHDTMSQN